MRRALATIALLCVGCTVDAGANPSYCGPGDTCPAGQRCYRPSGASIGLCVSQPDAGCMPVGQETCNGADDDCDREIDEGLLRLPESCGSCDVQCQAPNPDCVPDGLGSFMCGAGCPFSMCPSGCVDVQTDEQNCGSCSNRCDPGEDCASGGCRCGGVGDDCEGITSSTCCGTQCVDLNTSNAHCGGCGRACPAGSQCIDQQCRCMGAGNRDCRTRCVVTECVGL